MAVYTIPYCIKSNKQSLFTLQHVDLREKYAAMLDGKNAAAAVAQSAGIKVINAVRISLEWCMRMSEEDDVGIRLGGEAFQPRHMIFHAVEVAVGINDAPLVKSYGLGLSDRTTEKGGTHIAVAADDEPCRRWLPVAAHRIGNDFGVGKPVAEKYYGIYPATALKGAAHEMHRTVGVGDDKASQPRRG